MENIEFFSNLRKFLKSSERERCDSASKLLKFLVETSGKDDMDMSLKEAFCERKSPAKKKFWKSFLKKK